MYPLVVVLTWDFNKYRCAYDILARYRLLILNGSQGVKKEDAPPLNVCDTCIINGVDFKNARELYNIVKEWAAGEAIYRIISIEELTLIPAATLRDMFGVKGKGELDVVPFRDKGIMLDIVSKSGLKHPKYELYNDFDQAKTFLGEYKKIIIKPVYGVGSKDTVVIRDEKELFKAVNSLREKKEYILQEYIEGSLYHCDTVVINGSIPFLNIMEYQSQTIDYNKNDFLVSISEENDVIRKKINSYVVELIAAFGIENNVLHIEVFVANDGVVFCELAIRAGGAGVVPIVEYLYNVNLMYEDILYQLEGSYSRRVLQRTNATTLGGWLLFFALWVLIKMIC